MLGVAIVAVIVGVVIAISSGGGNDHSSAQHKHGREAAANRRVGGALGVAAAYLGVTRLELRRDLANGRSLAEIADARGGKSSAGLIAALFDAKATALRARARRTGQSQTALNAELTEARKVAHARAERLTLAGNVARSDVLASARYLGLSADQIRTQRESGHSLAQIAAAANGKTTAGLTKALVASRRALIAAEVHAGTITHAQAKRQLAALERRVIAQVNRTPPVAG